MPYETLAGGLELVIPTNSTKNWGTVLKNSTWTKINNHQHTGGGDGNQIVGDSIVDGAITSDKLNPHQFAKVQDLANGIPDVSNLLTIDLDLGNNTIIDMTAVTGDVALTLDNPLDGARYVFKILMGATPYDILWPPAVKFPAGEGPTQFMEASQKGCVWADYMGGEFICRWEIEY